MARWRIINGVLVLDKPQGLSSNQALQIVKRLYCARKAGHTGSLDPLASGMLPICFGEATKFSGFLLNADKSYRFVCRLGVNTATGDAEGEIVRVRPVIPRERTVVETIVKRFIGEIQQIPPMYSALKHQGQRLYQLARQGVEVERKARQVIIHSLRVVDMPSPDLLELEVRCSKGTYVRTLGEDIGEALGCGAHIVALRRIGVEPYEGARMVTLDALRMWAEQGFAALDAFLLPIDTALAVWPAVRLRGDTAYYLGQGQAVMVSQAPTQGWVRLYERGAASVRADRFLGVGEILDDGAARRTRLLGFLCRVRL